MEKILGLFETYPPEYDLGQVFFVLSAAVLSLFITYLFIKSLPYLKPIKIAKKAEERFQLDLSNPKETAYRITFLIHKYSTPYNKELLERLERFKYRKNVEDLDKDTLDLISKFMEYVRKNNGRV